MHVLEWNKGIVNVLEAFVQSRQLFFCSLIAFLAFLILSSCSMPAKKSLAQPKSPASNVSKAEYDALLKRHELLQNEVRELKSYQRRKLGEEAQAAQDVKEPVGAELIQTVNVFSDENKFGKGAVPQPIGVKEVKPSPKAKSDIKFITNLSDEDVKILENDILELRKAQAFLEQGERREGMRILTNLQQSSYRQVQVRAQFLIGENFFNQKEFDLALQAYEEIIHRSAFSGLVIRALGRLVTCAEKLGIDNKKDQYYSMLNDFFEGV